MGKGVGGSQQEKQLPWPTTTTHISNNLTDQLVIAHIHNYGSVHFLLPFPISGEIILHLIKLLVTNTDNINFIMQLFLIEVLEYIHEKFIM